MTIEELTEFWEKNDDEEFLKESRLPSSDCKRSDLRAFLLLDKLVPGTRDIVSCAAHDEIWLDVDLEELAKAATQDDILTLIRCGVRLDGESLAMFV